MPSSFITEYNLSSIQPRSISPLTLCSTTMHTTSSSKHAADISRLLDPSYCSASTASKGYASPQAYVDPYGDLHDPDYRHFPTSFPSSSSPPSRRHNSPRPHWELTLDNEHALDEDSELEEEEDCFFLSTSTAAHPQHHSRYSASAARRLSHNSSGGWRRPRESSFSTYSSNYYSPTGTTSTLPTSYESDKTVLSRCSDADDKEGKKTKKGRRLSKGDKEKEKDREESSSWCGSGPATAATAAETYYRGSLDRYRDLPPTEEEEAEDNQHARLGMSPKAKGILILTNVDFVPSCTHSLRRQWQAMILRFRFGVFRAQKKMMRRVHSFL